MNNEIPVFLFNGFLDSGKTTLIKEIIEGESAYHDYNTLIIAFEDGETQYDEEWIKNNEINVVVVEDDEYLDELFFYELIKKYNPKQIVMELNAFVDFNELRLPRNFAVYQEVTLFDTTKFELYYNNMKPLINRMVQYSSLIVFNRCTNNIDNLGRYRRYIRAFNQSGNVAFENEDGKLTTILNEDLPYDINGGRIVISDKDFPIFYLDITECYDKYENKEIVFNAYIREITAETIVVGRKIMTCCEDDIQFYGFEGLTNKNVKNNCYVRVTCKPIKHYSSIAQANVIMLDIIDIKELDYVEENYLEF